MSDDDTPDSRKERLAPLQHFVRHPKGTAARKKNDDRLNAIWRNNPEFRKEIIQKHQRASATITAQQKSGAGYPSDAALREFQLDYNNRLTQYGAGYMPTSFNINEAFFQLRNDFAGFFLLPEEDYLVSFTDFVDFITGPDSTKIDIGYASNIKADTIINVNTLETPGEFMFTAEGGQSFAIIGSSYVRRGDEISMLLVVGEQMPEEDLASLKKRADEPRLIGTHKPDFVLDETLAPGVVFIDESERLVRDLVLCRFNLKERRIEARCLMRDVGNSYTVLTDIEETLKPLGREAHEWSERMGEKLDNVSVVWDCAKMLLMLPAYLAARITFNKVEQRTTQFGLQTRNSLKFRRSTINALPDAKVIFRKISAIRVEKQIQPATLAGRSYTPPAFQVSVTGYWRTYLNPEQQGHDEQGMPVKGKTWVKPHIRFKDKSEGQEQKVVYIKSSLSNARRTLERYRAKQQSVVVASPRTEIIPSTVTTTSTSPVDVLSGAYVYVMRCPAHGRDIYKVGYTDRDPELRARELSSSTGNPTMFLVVQAWAVTDGRAAENATHEELAKWRLSGNREFFQINYSSLRETLERVIKPWVLS